MGRYRHKVYEKSTTPRWVAVFGLQWQVIECYRLEPGANLFGAMTSAVQRLVVEGWRPESDPRFGFVFIRKEIDRRLLLLTPRDPFDARPQSFSPFKSTRPI
jgi:hypothetical protein